MTMTQKFMNKQGKLPLYQPLHIEHCLPSSNFFNSNFLNSILSQENASESPISIEEQDSHNK